MPARLLGFLLVALLALPTSWATHATSDTTHSTEHCAGHADHSTEDCACCPDGGVSGSSCIYTCMIGIAIPVASLEVPKDVTVLEAPEHSAAAFTTRADLPFKPPPIL